MCSFEMCALLTNVKKSLLGTVSVSISLKRVAQPEGMRRALTLSFKAMQVVSVTSSSSPPLANAVDFVADLKLDADASILDINFTISYSCGISEFNTRRGGRFANSNIDPCERADNLCHCYPKTKSCFFRGCAKLYCSSLSKLFGLSKS